MRVEAALTWVIVSQEQFLYPRQSSWDQQRWIGCVTM
jgi:hypothetical protein